MNAVSLVIRCYNEERHIGRLLEGITKQTIRDVEIIVVDSGSTDSTISIASQYPAKIVSIQPEEFSFGRSLNIGCSNAHGDIIVIASAHIYPVYNDWLEKLLEPFTDPKVALVYGKQRGNETTRYGEHQIFTRLFPEISVSRQDHPFCNNANAAIRRLVWEQLPYNEALTGLEDLDWAKRMMAIGYHISYSAEAEIVHIHNEKPRQIYNRYWREAFAHKQIFPDQKFSSWDFIGLFFGNVASDYYHAWFEGVLRRNLWDIFMFRLMQFWGSFRGFAQRTAVTSQLKQRFYYPNGRGAKSRNPIKRPDASRIEYTGLGQGGSND